MAPHHGVRGHPKTQVQRVDRLTTGPGFSPGSAFVPNSQVVLVTAILTARLLHDTRTTQAEHALRR